MTGPTMWTSPPPSQRDDIGDGNLRGGGEVGTPYAEFNLTHRTLASTVQNGTGAALTAFRAVRSVGTSIATAFGPSASATSVELGAPAPTFSPPQQESVPNSKDWR